MEKPEVVVATVTDVTVFVQKSLEAQTLAGKTLFLEISPHFLDANHDGFQKRKISAPAFPGVSSPRTTGRPRWRLVELTLKKPSNQPPSNVSTLRGFRNGETKSSSS